MKIGIFGCGSVARTVGAGLAHAGHTVWLSSRDLESDNAKQWQATGGTVASFADVAGFADVLINALSGSATLPILTALNADTVSGKVLIDLANPLDFSAGFPPTFTVTNTDSLGEQVQRALPDVHVVKALNTVNTSVMVNPEIVLAGPTDLFICGNDPAAKQIVRALLLDLGWSNDSVRDVGDISASRGTEGYLALWVRLMNSFGTSTFNVRVVRQ